MAHRVLNLCRGAIGKSAQQLTPAAGSKDYLMNREQCGLLVKKLSETDRVLLDVQQSPLVDGKTIPVLQELHQVLLDAETLIDSSFVTTSRLLRAAIEQGDMKETFSRLLYDIQWHTCVLQSILVDKFGKSQITFDAAMCNGELNIGDTFYLLTAIEEDEKSLLDRLRSMKLDDPTEQELANQLLSRMKAVQDEPSPALLVEDSSQLLQANEEQAKLLQRTSSFNFLFLNPQHINCSGWIGGGSFGEVRKTTLLEGEYAVKIFHQYDKQSFDQEMAALQGLGYHPHIVRLLCYSESKAKCFLIMEKMGQDLARALDMWKENNIKLSDVEAVDLMLQIAEGVRYIHSKGMAHRDLKPGNVLVNLAEPESNSSSSRKICSVKIADFGLTKTKDANQTHSNQTVNRGTSKWMAPEVIKEEGGPDSVRCNLKKADAYSFAIMCSKILTGEDPFGKVSMNQVKMEVKAGRTRPNLPEECPPRLASLIKRCWSGFYYDRPLFPEICRELRYIKGLLLRGDQKRLETQLEGVLPSRSMEGAQMQGPWGGEPLGTTFWDMATGIKRIKLEYLKSPGAVGLMEVEYEFLGTTFVRRYCDGRNWNRREEIIFQPCEFITKISGFVAQIEVTNKAGKGRGPKRTITIVGSLTIHTNLKSYGPFGAEEGEQFTSDTGRIIGLHGADYGCLACLGIVIIPSGQVDS